MMISSFVFCMFVWFRLNAACLRVVVMYMLKQCGWNVFLPVWKKRILGQARQTFWLTREQRCQEQNGREFANIDHDTMYSSKPLRLYPLADV